MRHWLARLRSFPKRRLVAGFVAAGMSAGLASLAGPPKTDLIPALRLEPPRVVNRWTPDQEAFAKAIGAAAWRERGFAGQGVRVAILDTSFRSHRATVGRGLPAPLAVRSFRNDGDLEARDSQHGLLCAEVVHALAPQAELLFANWEPDSPASFLRAVRWAKSQGARVVTCSVVMPGWSDGDGGGAVNAELRAIVGDGTRVDDVLFAAAAGNLAERHWSGALTPDASGRHHWAPGQTSNRVVPWGTERVALELYGPSAADVTLQLLDRTTGAVLQETPARQDDDATWWSAALRFEPERDRDYAVGLRGPRERAGKSLHLAVLGGQLEHARSRGSIPFPADGDAVLAVGAAENADGLLRRIPYSSCGSNAGLAKPDFVGLAPTPSRLRGGRPFAGTSAASPQAAALAAVLWSRWPGRTPSEIRELLRQAAIDLGPPGHDAETGHGLLRLPDERGENAVRPASRVVIR